MRIRTKLIGLGTAAAALAATASLAVAQVGLTGPDGGPHQPSGVRVATFPGEKLRVDGRVARLSVQRPGRCGGVGADETISVAIARPLAGNWTQVDACLRGPKLAPLEQQVRALLASARFLTP